MGLLLLQLHVALKSKYGKFLYLPHNGIWLRKTMASAPRPTTDFIIKNT